MTLLSLISRKKPNGYTVTYSSQDLISKSSILLDSKEEAKSSADCKLVTSGIPKSIQFLLITYPSDSTLGDPPSEILMAKSISPSLSKSKTEGPLFSEIL